MEPMVQGVVIFFLRERRALCFGRGRKDDQRQVSLISFGDVFTRRLLGYQGFEVYRV